MRLSPALTRAYAMLATAQPQRPDRTPTHHTAPERAPRSQAWDAHTSTPIAVNYVPRFADGGFVGMFPAAADAEHSTLGYVAPASEAAAGYTPGMFDDLIAEAEAPEPDDVVTSAAPWEADDVPLPRSASLAARDGSGMFNDLTPLAGNDAPSGGMFDDLIEQYAAADLATASAETPATDAEPLGWLEYAEGMAQKAAQGVTLGFADELAAGIGSLAGKRSYDEILNEVRGREKEFEKAQPKTALAAEIAGSLGSGATAARLLARAPGWLGRPGYARSALGAGATAAPLGAVSEVGRLEGRDKTIGDYTDAALEGGKTAALFGTGIGAAGHSLARVVGPWASAQAQRLSDRGIRLTPGQLIGPNAKRIEDVVTSWPGANIMVRGRREEAVNDLNRVAIEDALAPIGARLPRDIAMGHDAVAAAGDEISAAYQRAVPRMEGLRDAGLQNQLFRLSTRLPPEQEQQFANYVSRELDNVAPLGARIAGDDMQHLIGVSAPRATA